MRRLVVFALLAPVLGGCGALHRATEREALVSSINQDVPSWIKQENLPPEAVPGANLFAVAGCTVCHTYLGSGASNLGAPDLTAIGLRHLGIAGEIKHLQCPSCISAGSPMPSFASLGKKRLTQLAIFLEASKRTR
jgi:hypothetical protein